MFNCRSCKLELDDSLIKLKKSRWGKPVCKLCHNDYERNRRKADLAKQREIYQNFKRNNPKAFKEYSRNALLKRYGLTKEQYLALFNQQQGKCKICGVDEVDARQGRFHIDHCHKTGTIRGLLCQACNTGLGHFQDSLDLLIRAGKYLSNTQI